MNDFQEIKSRTDFTQLVTSVSRGDLKKIGSDKLRLNPCPICNHSNSFTIFKNQSYKCFSLTCGSGGDMFNFIEDYFKISDPYEVLKKAADLTGYELQNSNDVQKIAPEITTRKKIFNAAAEYYNANLLADKQAMEILKKTRDYDSEIIKENKIGYTGKSWTGLYNHLKDQFSNDVLKSSGLIKDRKGKTQDSFVPGMFVFPHYQGKQVCDFSCKDSMKHTKKPDEVIQQRLISEKRIGTIYFYNQDALFSDQVIITEGEHDAIQLNRYLGKNNVMAITGNPSDEAMKYLYSRSSGKTFYLAFDADQAGDNYCKKFFIDLWGSSVVKMIDWDRQLGKDIDEYLRTLISAN